MKLSSIRPRIAKAIENHRYEKEKRFLETFAPIDSTNISSETLKELLPARLGIAKYAEENGVSIEIKNAKNLLSDIEHDSASVTKAEERHKKSLLVTVTDILHNRGRSRIVSGDTKALHLHSEPDYFVINYSDDGIQQTRLTSHDYEDNFLRNLYRNIEGLVKEVQKNIKNS